VIGEHRSARSRHESDEALEEGRGLEAEGLGAVGEGAREKEEELTLGREGELLGGEGRAEDVARESFAAETFARGDADGGVKREAGVASARGRRRCEAEAARSLSASLPCRLPRCPRMGSLHALVFHPPSASARLTPLLLPQTS
jgi:hypothetical protein